MTYRPPTSDSENATQTYAATSKSALLPSIVRSEYSMMALSTAKTAHLRRA
jgi:hypothetical protein